MSICVFVFIIYLLRLCLNYFNGGGGGSLKFSTHNWNLLVCMLTFSPLKKRSLIYKKQSCAMYMCFCFYVFKQLLFKNLI